MFWTITSVKTKDCYNKLFGTKEDDELCGKEEDRPPKSLWKIKVKNLNIINASDENGKSKTCSFKCSVSPTKENYRLLKIEKALERAHDIRKFEIDKYWSRATYFWAFTASVYAAYFYVLKDLHCKQHGKFSLVALAALGLFFSFSWWLSSKGSRHWQENWESHVDLLENEITGPLYKTFLSANAPSITKVNEVAGFVMSVCGFCLLFYEFTELYKANCIWGGRYILLSLLTTIFVCSALFVYYKSIAGNTQKSGDFQFKSRKFEDML